MEAVFSIRSSSSETNLTDEKKYIIKKDKKNKFCKIT